MNSLETGIKKLQQPELLALPPGQSQVLIDFDSTMYPLLQAMRSYPGGEAVDITSCLSWEALQQQCGGSQQMLRLFEQAMSLSGMRRVGLFPGVRAASECLRDHGVKIHIVTHRNKTLETDTQTFLQEQRVVFDTLVCDLQTDKLSYARDHNIRVLVDDHPELIEQAHQLGFSAHTLRWPYNAEIVSRHGLTGAEDWLQLTREVLVALAARC